ncbi:uncharacterized protein LOC143915436 isoform X2 [Arctopsyche grandis]|uniref:uncharacterized protein LOC143915436 isoform X2 n=1 Tax=Arctopsyche grandis TaxID=121162 RepID=UPI00406D846E
MYVIFPADEVVYFTYGTQSPLVRPRPTLDHLHEPRVPLRPPTPDSSPTSTTDSFKDRDYYYTGPDVSANRTSASSPPLSRPPSAAFNRQSQQLDKPKEKKHRFLRLKKSEDPNFGRTQRSPNIYNYEQPMPLPTPAFSKKNIFDHNFDALFEVSNAPEFTENIRVVTPEPPRPNSFQDLLLEEATTPEDIEDDWRLSDEVTPIPYKDCLKPPPLSAPSTPRSERKNARNSRKTPAIDKSSSLEEHSPRKKSGFLSRIRRVSSEGRTANRMASGQGEAVLRELTHPNLNEHLKNHNAVSFKLVKTVSDFTSQLSQMYEQQAGELQMLVATYRKKNNELRKERPACPSSLFHTWETLLQEVETDSQAHSDVALALNRQVSRPMVERTFYRKLQSRKVFAHRESYETIISKTEEKLTKCRQEYKSAHQAYVQSPSQATLVGYMDGHNAYVQQLHATNGMLDEYNQETLPQLLQELEDIYNDVCVTLSDAVLQGAEVVASRATDQTRRYETLGAQCRAVNGTTDLAHLARGLPQPAPSRGPRKPFAPPLGVLHHNDNDNENVDAIQSDNVPPALKDELVLERLGPMQIRSNYDSLKKEALDLELQIKQLQDSLDNMVRLQQRSIENHLFNKANELQEDISMKKFDLRVAQIHLSAVKAQKELFAAKADPADVDRKLSSSSSGSMKNKWLKAFKSLKPTNATSQSAQSAQNIDKKNGSGKDLRSSGDMESHNFLEYTYKKITPCDVCSQVLRGHTRQGLRCRLCKMNVHSDCMGSSGKCQTKSKLLRRQKSTSELEPRLQDIQHQDEDKIASTGTRPFGQPLCFVQDVEEPPSPVKTKKKFPKTVNKKP